MEGLFAPLWEVNMLSRLLFGIAKAPLMGRIVGYAFQYCGWAIPVKKVCGGKDIIAFKHPRPSYENHIILSPKRAIGSLRHMASDGFSGYLAKIWEAAMGLQAACPEYHDAFVLVANGGKRQEVRQVHFHMFTHYPMVNGFPDQKGNASVISRDGAIEILKHPNPNWELHYMIRPTGRAEDQHAYFDDVLRGVERLNDQFDLERKGYALVSQYDQRVSCVERPVFHVVSGTRLS